MTVLGIWQNSAMELSRCFVLRILKLCIVTMHLTNKLCALLMYVN